jgi:hypothetical protein
MGSVWNSRLAETQQSLATHICNAHAHLISDLRTKYPDTFRGLVGEDGTIDRSLCPPAETDPTASRLQHFEADPEVLRLYGPCIEALRRTEAVPEVISGLKTPYDRPVRFLSPALRGDPPCKIHGKPNLSQIKYPEFQMKEILLSGCTDKEYSGDALINGVYHGEMTYFALRAIREANYAPTWQQIHTRLANLIDDAG